MQNTPWCVCVCNSYNIMHKPRSILHLCIAAGVSAVVLHCYCGHHGMALLFCCFPLSCARPISWTTLGASMMQPWRWDLCQAWKHIASTVSEISYNDSQVSASCCSTLHNAHCLVCQPCITKVQRLPSCHDAIAPVPLWNLDKRDTRSCGRAGGYPMEFDAQK